MPKLFETNEDNPLEPCHVHVAKGSSYAEVWIEPVQLAQSHGLSKSEQRFIATQVSLHKAEILEAWNEYFT